MNASRRRMAILLSSFLLITVLGLLLVGFLPATQPYGLAATPTPVESNATPNAPNEVNVVPAARDEAISQRLKSILDSTGWFINPQVKVKDGVVFLTGKTTTTDYKNWAGDLARNTQDVVAVVNKLQLQQPSIWDFQPALNGLRDFWIGLIGSIPVIIFCLLVMLITYLVLRISMAAARASLRRYLHNPLLSNVGAYSLGVVLFLIGLYIALQVAGLTNVATTVVGGTGLLGLVLGIAFRDISENFLASIFLSLQNPFHTNDLVEINGILGFVQALTIRVTILMTLEGTIVQIPNSTVYQSNIYNYSSNPNRQADFIIGIGYNESIIEAQDTVMKVLKDHPAVLNDPEPLVLVETLASSSVNLHIYFWLNIDQNSWIKVKSSVIRLVKLAFQNADITMPDESREVIFPEGIPLKWGKPEGELSAIPAPGRAAKAKIAEEPASVSTESEAGLTSEAEDIQEQARGARISEEGENLLKPSETD